VILPGYLWLVPLGMALGALGTLLGAGGGFVLVPVLLLLYPQADPDTVTSISLAVVFLNALSGSWAYARMKRIDYRSGLILAAAAIPGAVIGALTTDLIPRRIFDGVFGLLLFAVAAYLFLHREEGTIVTNRAGGRKVCWDVVESDGTIHPISYDPLLGVVMSVVVGYLSSMLGIGGGIVHVPALVRLLGFPVHVATATSHFILVFMALAGTVAHIAAGSFAHGGLRRTIALGIGVLVGAQIGASLSRRVHGRWIIRGLAVALAFVGARVLVMAIHG